MKITVDISPEEMLELVKGNGELLSEFYKKISEEIVKKMVPSSEKDGQLEWFNRFWWK